MEGLENAPKAFIGLFVGENLGKQLVSVAHDGNEKKLKKDPATKSKK